VFAVNNFFKMQEQEDKIPVFKTWNAWYAFVLIFLFVLILLFKLFTNFFA